VPFDDPTTGEKVWLFGFQAAYSGANSRIGSFLAGDGFTYSARAHFFIRRANGTRYDVAEVTDALNRKLVAPRGIAVSPFPSDNGLALYLGGFDCNSARSHDTAWIYRAEVYR
jgi:hypothetical protein